ncbi:hypothetical protein AcW2_006880 [Taiwanofungus camphoratus]|nr:hypothetical protein AcW2_006880 [Antrodia cinnamomea]
MYAQTDTGTLGIGLVIDPFIDILNSVPGASIDNSSALGGFLILPSNMTVDSLPTLSIGLGNLTFSFHASDCVVPAALYSSLNITDSEYHTWIVSGGDQFSIGTQFFEKAYTAYDNMFSSAEHFRWHYSRTYNQLTVENNLIGFANLA